MQKGARTERDEEVSSWSFSRAQTRLKTGEETLGEVSWLPPLLFIEPELDARKGMGLQQGLDRTRQKEHGPDRRSSTAIPRPSGPERQTGGRVRELQLGRPCLRSSLR